MLLLSSSHHFAKSMPLGIGLLSCAEASQSLGQGSHMAQVAKVAMLSLTNGIKCDGVCSQLSPSVLLPAEVTGAAVADAPMAHVANALTATSPALSRSVRSMLIQNHHGRRMQAPYGAFFVVSYSYADNYFGDFYFGEGYIS